MRRVMAQGAFDVLHPGHLHYLRESAALGDELSVVVARDARVPDPGPFVDERSRREVVDALAVVDAAILGPEGDAFESVERVDPAVITLGHDQPFDPGELEARLADEGFDVEVVRIGPYEGGGVASSTDVERRIEAWSNRAVFDDIG